MILLKERIQFQIQRISLLINRPPFFDHIILQNDLSVFYQMAVHTDRIVFHIILNAGK